MDEAADKQRLRAAARKLRVKAQADDPEGKAAEQVAAHFMAAFSRHAGLGPDSGHAGLRPNPDHAGLRPNPDHAGLRPNPDHAGLRPNLDHGGLRPNPDHAGLRPDAVVAGYWPLGSEMDVRPLMIRLAAVGAKLVLPVTRAADLPLEFRRWRPGDALQPGAHGVMQPLPSASAAVPTVLLVPLLAFDGEGWRLGYGAGYYDRTLADLRGRLLTTRPLAVGIAYAAQEMTALPHHAGDQQLDGVVTERAARRFR